MITRLRILTLCLVLASCALARAEETPSQHYAKSEDVYRYAIGRNNLSLGLGYGQYSLEHSGATPRPAYKPVISFRYRHNFSEWFKIEYTGSYSGPHSDYWTFDLAGDGVLNGPESVANSLATARFGRAFNFRNSQVGVYGGILLFLPSGSSEPHLTRFHMGIAGLSYQYTFKGGSVFLLDGNFMSINGVQTLYGRATFGRRLQLYLQHLQFNVEQSEDITNVVQRSLAAGLLFHLF